MVVALVAPGSRFRRRVRCCSSRLLALCMNRFVFFPNETGVTADAAVLFAAMVAFGGDAAWLGPLCLALLVGPLDAKHWGTRSFARMAYNSGSTALATAAGLAVFVPLAHTLGSGWTAALGAVAASAVPYVVTESVLGVVLLVLLGEPPVLRCAIRFHPPSSRSRSHSRARPAGLAALDVGWWCAFLLLLPMPWVPELTVRRGAAAGAFVVADGARLARPWRWSASHGGPARGPSSRGYERRGARGVEVGG